jgi:broad specificity phosphatase PhoE
MNNIIDKNIVIISHSRRIRKLLKDYFINYNNNKFKNCCILLITFDILNKKTIIKLLYEGEINENRDLKKYYTLTEFNSSNIYSHKLIVPENINIFIIRHAQGYHNLTYSLLDKTIKKTKLFFNLTENNELKDPQLTDNGIIQAKDCGAFLYNYININKLNINKFLCFCSILYRTRQTIKYILTKCKLNLDNIYILPCNHELSDIYNEKNDVKYGRCINKSEQELYECNTLSIDNDNDNYNDIDIDNDIDNYNDNYNIKKNINWNYFINFKENNDMCTNTNMIYETYLLFANLIGNEKYNDLKKKLIL